MKKLTILIPVAVLFIAATMTSCAGNIGSTTTGYSVINWDKNIMKPAAGKSFLMDTMDSTQSAYDDLISVCYSAASKALSTDNATTNFTGFAIASDDRSERLIILIKDYDLFDDTKSFPEALDTFVNTVVITYFDGSSVSTYTGPLEASIDYSEVITGDNDANGDPVTYYEAILDITAGSYSVGSLSIDSADSITAMTYPYTEPTLY